MLRICERSLVVSLVAAAAVAVTRAEPSTALTDVLQHAGERVERYFTRAQSLVCLEVVRLQPLNSGWGSDGWGRTVESELRLSWQPEADGKASTEAQTVRQLLKVNGQPPRKNDWNNCTTPEQQSAEPHALSLLLAGQQSGYQFSLAGQERVDGRMAIMVDYREVKRVSVESWLIEGRNDCVSFDVQGGMRGRMWIDANSYDVLRLDQRLSGQIDIPLPRAVLRMPGSPQTWTMERWDTTIRFRRVSFQNPEEALVLPESLSSMRVTRGAGTPRLRVTTDYKNYQRFLTAGRIVGE